MGSSRWTTTAYDNYASTTNYESLSREQVFSNTTIPASLDPSKIVLRESCDSDVNPNSMPIILGLDVTGSMGEYAELIAKKALPELMTQMYESSPVKDPHLMFMGIDDVHAWSSGGPLQVSQFEADIKILEQLREIYLVGGGGGNNSESYDLAWYFAAYKTKIDSLTKRNKKGYLFTFGDEMAPYESLSVKDLTRVFGKGQYEPSSPAQTLKAAQEKYKVFHVIIEQGSFYQSRGSVVRQTWTEMLGNNVLFLKDFKNLSELVINTIKIAEGEDINAVIQQTKNPSAMQYAFENALSN